MRVIVGPGTDLPGTVRRRPFGSRRRPSAAGHGRHAVEVSFAEIVSRIQKYSPPEELQERRLERMDGDIVRRVERDAEVRRVVGARKRRRALAGDGPAVDRRRRRPERQRADRSQSTAARRSAPASPTPASSIATTCSCSRCCSAPASGCSVSPTRTPRRSP